MPKQLVKAQEGRSVFENALKKLVGEVAGARGAAVLGLKGVLIEAVDAKGHACTAEDVTIEYAQALDLLMGVQDESDLGEPKWMTVRGETHSCLLRFLSPHYVVALSMPADTIEAQGHFMLRVASPDLAREL